MEKKCLTCRYWDAHSQDLNLGDCRAPGNHRYSRVPVEGKNKDGKPWWSVACLDSFGKEETGPHFVCGVWAAGEPANA